MDIQEIRQLILEQMPPETRFQDSDAQIITKHKELLLSWQEEIVDSFYKTVFSHPNTSNIFHEGERAAREETLRDWWKKVVEGPIDDKFWNWMAYVGLVHVHRKVKNSMMLSMWGLLLHRITTKAEASLSLAEATDLIRAFTRFGQTLTSLVAESYMKGIAEATGTSLDLLENLAVHQVGPELPAIKGKL